MLVNAAWRAQLSDTVAFGDRCLPVLDDCHCHTGDVERFHCARGIGIEILWRRCEQGKSQQCGEEGVTPAGRTRLHIALHHIMNGATSWSDTSPRATSRKA